MIHIRVDNEENSKQRMACGIGPTLPEGDKYFFESESQAYRHCSCQGCLVGMGMTEEEARKAVHEKEELGTPISQLSGRPGEPGYEEFCRIARSWGY